MGALQNCSAPHRHISTIPPRASPVERIYTIENIEIEKVTDFLGQPRFLFIILVFVSLWMVVNILLDTFRLPNFDPPPFIWLQGVITLAALLEATMILITQNRQDTMTGRRTQLDLQVSLILDQKVSKLITMVDELHRVHPDLENGTDPQVEALKKTVDPHQSIKTLNQLLDEEEQE
jgi:uncharacterized membrane protein